jgi:activator of HSP90 ATPase
LYLGPIGGFLIYLNGLFCLSLTNFSTLKNSDRNKTMRNVIRQSVVLPASAEKLFQMYITSSTHQAITGAPVAIGDKRGSKFKAFDGALTGTTLAVIKPRLIIQSWRSVNFMTEDPDSTLILSFTSEGNEGRIDLIHLDVPDQDYDGVNQGWEKYYWTPWRTYLASMK